GQHSHLDTDPDAIFDNDKDIDDLPARIADYAQTRPLRYGFLLRGHGLSSWGKDIQEARRHLVGLVFLFACEMMRRRYE
ncbi:class II aldolase/adducin family protein, partial [Klebsiella variicola]|uniref:class II aldolase/adducin family protein n=1 Tax=Klebsiella variicola TaxID=244366 RepID=UPI002730FC86